MTHRFPRAGRSAALVLVLAALLVPPPAAAAASLPAGDPVAAGVSAERLARLDAVVEAEITAGRKAGAVILIVRRGEVVHHRAYGFADREEGRPMRPDSVFRLYSMTKPLTSVALLTLFEEGRFRLTDPLARHAPALAGLKVWAGTGEDGRPILEEPRRPPTIQDVMRHTAGFTYGAFGDHPVDRLYRERGIGYERIRSIRQLAEELLPSVPLLYHPGDRWVYSFSHEVQSYLVERLSGMPFAEFLERRIFGPLGMDDTAFGVPAGLDGRFTSTYGHDGEGRLVRLETASGHPPEGSEGAPFGDYARYGEVPLGGNGLSSTAMDYARFAQMLAAGGELDGVRILGRKTVELMRRDHLPPGVPSINDDGDDIGIGYGLGVGVTLDPARAGNLDSPGQFGWQGYATTGVWIDPAEELVVVAMTQYVPFDPSFLDRVQTLVYQALVD